MDNGQLLAKKGPRPFGRGPRLLRPSLARKAFRLQRELAREVELGLAQLVAPAAEVAVCVEREDDEVVGGDEARDDVHALEAEHHLAHMAEPRVTPRALCVAHE